MGFRFRRSIKLAPGLKLNVGKTGVSLTSGVRGASMTIGPRGTYANLGLPGTGLSYRTRLDKKSPSSRELARAEREYRQATAGCPIHGAIWNRGLNYGLWAI